LDDIVSGEEARRRRNQRADQRPKDGLFAVKQLEQARQWLMTFLDVAVERPQRAFKLDVGQYPKGMGAILLINNKLVKALAFKVTKVDAEQLNFEDSWQSSASQGIVEMLAVLLALKAWTTQPASASDAIGQHDCTGHDPEVEQPVTHLELHRGRDRDSVL